MKKILTELRANPQFKKYEMFIAPVVVAILVILMIVFVIIPNFFQYIETNKKMKDAEDRITFYTNKKTELQAISKDQYTLGINNSLAILPSDKESPAAISQLYYVVGLTNLQIQNITFSDGGDDKSGKSFRISIDVSGGLADLTNFIIKVKETPRIFRIQSLEVSAPSGSETVSASLILGAYYEPLPKEISTLDQPLVKISDKDLEMLNRLSTTSFPIVSENSSYSGPKGKENPFE